jgi:hypothetical protein
MTENAKNLFSVYVIITIYLKNIFGIFVMIDLFSKR